MAYIKKLSTGRWQARYRDDERREHAGNFATKAGAKRWLDDVTASRVRGDYVDPHAGRAKVSAYAERWYDSTVVLKPKTRLGYRQLLDVHVLPRWGAVELRTVTASPLADQRFLTADELTALAEKMPSDRDRILVLVLGWSGLRFGEAIALRSSDVDILRRRIRIERSAVEVGSEVVVGSPKTHQARTVTLPRFLADDLAAHMATVDHGGLLFPDERGGYLRNTNWRRRAFDPSVTRAKLSPLRVHDLRHTAASLSIRAGASVKAVQSQLGHASATMTLDRYGHLWSDELDALSDALDAVAARSAADSVRTPEPAAQVVALADHR
jgi:integrase